MTKIKQWFSKIIFWNVCMRSFFLGVFVVAAYTWILPKILGPVIEKPIWEQKAEWIDECKAQWFGGWGNECRDSAELRFPEPFIQQALDHEYNIRKAALDGMKLPPQ